MAMSRLLHLWVALLTAPSLLAQKPDLRHWSADGQARIEWSEGSVVETRLASRQTRPLVAKEVLQRGLGDGEVDAFLPSADGGKMLFFTRTERVWRYHTRGDYHVLDRASGGWRRLGAGLPDRSLMFAKFSPDARRAAYVSRYNLYVEDLSTGAVRALTTDGHRRLINGTFDWVYEEEFACRDGFRWSPDGRHIAFWQVDAAGTRDFLMINNTDSVYARTLPVEYPKVGEPPSAVRIGIADVEGGGIVWMRIPGDPRQHYLPRMEWLPDGSGVIVQQLDRRQQRSTLWRCSVADGSARQVLDEKDDAWVDILPSWDADYDYGGWDWLDGGRSFLWASEADGWRHLYRVPLDGGQPQLLTPGDYDVMDIVRVDEPGGYLYFAASPDDATQKYLFRVKMDGASKPERLTPEGQPGTHEYDIAPGARHAFHRFSSHRVAPVSEWVELPAHRGKDGGSPVAAAVRASASKPGPVEFFRLRTADGVEMDGWMVRPAGFDPKKKYPVLFYVYSEPAAQTVTDRWGVGRHPLYQGDLSRDGYLYVSLDNRGTPAPKGRAWRKAVYRKIGVVNIRDQAMAARAFLQRPYADTSRVAVWGWSGGGSATLNLMFRHPEVYGTGIAIAAVANQLTYDNIYQERYMGLPQENRQDFVEGSPVTHARNLKGNLLYIHGTADDNVHYQNAEMLVDELVRHNRQFQFMAYPNRSHGLSEGEGTWRHLSTLYTDYLRKHCPPGGR
jgi:dipeptidyl-peptidase-4